MTLTDLVRLHFEKNVFRGTNIPEGNIREGYASHIELQHGSWPNAVRMGRAWDRPPTERKLSKDKIGTYNVGLPPLIATVMQELRESSVDPTNSEHVQKFQRQIAQVTQLITPLILTNILLREYEMESPVEITCNIKHAQGTLSLPYEAVFAEKINKVRTRKSKVTTVSGYHSHATIAELDIEKIAIQVNISMDYMLRKQRKLRVAFLAIHRGGILPSLVAADLAEEMGCEAYIVGVDAKRKSEGGAHSGRVVGIDLKKPDGYAPSSYSELVADAYVFPTNYEKPDVLVVIDPMLATGLSSREAIEGCLETLDLKPKDVYCASFFAGGYRGMQTLMDAGYRVHVVAHDQLPLNPSDYIIPGLGDAGDKMSGIVMGQDVKDIYQLLKSMEHLVEANAVSMERLEMYSRQMTGKRLAA